MRNFPFYTIGHSTRTIEQFVSLLHASNVELVVDIRSIPRSRANPQYNKEIIAANLAVFGVGYLHLSELGGRRNKAKNVSSEINSLWQNKSFHYYADYALSDDFRYGLDKLISLGRKQQCTLMCSEAVWWRCHRRIVSDYLLAQGETVFHLMDKSHVQTAILTKGACITSSQNVVYPATHLPDCSQAITNKNQ